MSDLPDRTRWEPAEAEARIFARWLESGLLHPEPGGTADENFSIAVPPPNVTGRAAHGPRAQRLGAGLHGPLPPDAGRAHQVDARHRPRRHRHPDAGREAAAGRGDVAARSSAARRSSSASGSGARSTAGSSSASSSGSARRWTTRKSASRSTRRYVRAVMKVFVELYEKGLIYRDNYMVNWDPGSRSAISDLEVEEREVTDTLYYVDYPLASGVGSITVATVRPETMLADTAIAVHPDDERYTRLVGETAILPLVGRRLRIIADPYVKPEFGTGALKITPGHDPNDFEIGRAHGLEEIVVIGEDGRLNDNAPERVPRHDRARGARGGRRRAAREERVIARTEPHLHAVPFSHRSGERIEPLISLQWFMKMDELAAPAIAAVERRPAAHPPREPAQALPRLAGEHPPLVHLAPAVVGPPDPGLVPRRRDLRRDRAARGRGLGARPRRARHVVLVGPVAVRDARLARRHAGAARVLPDRRALHGPRHPLPVGRAHGDARDRVHRRGAVLRRLQPLDDPRPGRPADVQVAGHRHRPARRDRRARRRRHALRPARDVLDAGRALLRREGRAGPPARQQAVQRVAARAAARRRGRRARRRAAAAAGRRGRLDPLAPAAREGRDGARDRGVRVPPRRARPVRLRLRRAVRLVPRDRQAAPVRGGQRGRQPLRARRARRDARDRPPGDPVRDRGDLVATSPAPTACSWRAAGRRPTSR